MLLQGLVTGNTAVILVHTIFSHLIQPCFKYQIGIDAFPLFPERNESFLQKFSSDILNSSKPEKSFVDSRAIKFIHLLKRHWIPVPQFYQQLLFVPLWGKGQMYKCC